MVFNQLLDLDRFLLLAINQGLRKPVFDRLMPLISGTWPLIPIAGIGALCILFWGPPRAKRALLACVAVVIIGDSLNTHVLKRMFDRPRPYNTLAQVRVYDRQWFSPGTIPLDDSRSFPSNHAVNISAAAVIFIYYFRRWRLLAAAVVLLVCFSRVYLGVHYPSDVLVGLLIGTALGGLFLFTASRVRQTWRNYFSSRAKP